MKTLVARLVKGVTQLGKETRVRRKLVAEEEILIAKGREQFQRLLDKGLSIQLQFSN